MDTGVEFTIKDLASKCQSKSEFYNVLSTDGGLYLPPIQDATQGYLRSLMMGKKECLKSANVILIRVPHYKTLTIPKILEFARTKGDIDLYLPDYSYKKEPNREWLCNVINTLIGEEFRKFIKAKVMLRKNTLIQKSNLKITAKPEFISIFESSQSVSVQKGKSHFLVREQKRSKDAVMLDQAKQDKYESDKKVNLLHKELDELRNKLSELEEKQREFDYNEDKLAKLYELGVIDENANLISNDMK